MNYKLAKLKNPIKNKISLKHNLIITGPNASGKTTILKSVLINLILTQQFGCGFYDAKTKIRPYSHLYSYLNIHDTSGRDSLFQAEARRCKEIIDIINTSNSTSTHFCIFDELFSGTNPEEAVSSSTAFMHYLIKQKNVKCMLTTHYYRVCRNHSKNPTIINKHMEVIYKKIIDNTNNTNNTDISVNNQIKYTYRILKGISTIKGGLQVLTDMNYPIDIFNK